MGGIRSFCCADTQALANAARFRRFMAFERVAQHKLLQRQVAVTLNDLRAPPWNRLEPLYGDCLGQHSIRINDQFRLSASASSGVTSAPMTSRSSTTTEPTTTEGAMAQLSPITPDTDLRLCRFFGLSEGYWLRVQALHDLLLQRREIADQLEQILPNQPVPA